nr:hypothetical protein [Micromonospora provocatoris]
MSFARVGVVTAPDCQPSAVTAAVRSASSCRWVGQQVTFALSRRSPLATV